MILYTLATIIMILLLSQYNQQKIKFSLLSFYMLVKFYKILFCRILQLLCFKNTLSSIVCRLFILFLFSLGYHMFIGYVDLTDDL